MNKKKPKDKKILTKLQAMKQHNLESILDAYFFKVCFDFYRRQMSLYCWMTYKYAKPADAAIQVTDD